MKKTKSTAPQVNPEEDTITAPAGDLKKVTDLACRMIVIEDEIATLEEKLKQQTEELSRIADHDLPSLMESFGMKEFSLKDGTKIVVKAITKASLPSESAIASQRDPIKQMELKDRFDRGIAYLNKLGAGAMVKNYVEAELGKESEALAKKAVVALDKLGIKASVFRGVHPNTLTSWVKERMEAGLEVDFDLLAVYTGQHAELKVPKTNKSVQKPGSKKSLF